MTAAPDTIWVTSELAPDLSTYIPTIHFSDDLSCPLNETDAVEYAVEFLRASAAAEYDAAILAQLTKLDMPKEAIGQAVADIRKERGPETWKVGPVTVTPGVSAFTGKPFLHCTVRDFTWQWAPADVRQHAQHVLEVLAAVDYDAVYRTYLINTIGLAPSQALAVVADIRNFRQG